MKLKDLFKEEEREFLSNCTICPRECRINRFEGELGYCRSGAGMNIASICIHRGEEPPISGLNGICNIFFTGCNMRCEYCQNHEISRGGSGCSSQDTDLEDVLDHIMKILSKGIKTVGFVSPSHVVPQVTAIIRGLNNRGLKPVTVYNTNSYDKPETLRKLNSLIDIYLPDFKYVTPEVAGNLSDTYNYPEVALRAIKEIYFQKGSTLKINHDGLAEEGILLRHLILPGYVEESIKVLRKIAEEISTGIHISLMSQYHPTSMVLTDPNLSGALSRAEYMEVVEEMHKLGFRNGWIQDMDSHLTYRPDFRKENPFE